MAVHKDECGSGVSIETIGTGKQPSEPGHVVSLLHFGPMALNVPDGRCADVAVWRPRHHWCATGDRPAKAMPSGQKRSRPLYRLGAASPSALSQMFHKWGLTFKRTKSYNVTVNVAM